MGKKGLSWEEKRQKILQIYLEKREVFNLKEIEKLGSKKGVVLQTIKDVNQSLVDDNLICFDKVGVGAFYWAFPSQALVTRKNLIANIDKHTEEKIYQTEEIETQIFVGKEKRDPKGISTETESMTREELQAELANLKQTQKQLSTEISKFERCDPEKIQKVQSDLVKIKSATERWTDNLFEIESYLKKNFNMSSEQLGQQFPVFVDLDYV